MDRADKGLAFMLQYENVAWYDGGSVRILDRRVYPRRVEFVECRRHTEVAQAIADMVTQSAGPYTAAAMGMALAAYECRGKNSDGILSYLENAAHTLSHARPTTAGRMEIITRGCLDAAKDAILRGEDVPSAIAAHAVAMNDNRYRRVEKMAHYLVEKFPQNGAIMTQCFGETIVGMMLKASREEGKKLRIFCPETRPYFQGARLTATVCRDMGFDVTVITDNMPAFVMENEGIDVFTCAADAITLDGHVANKVGTLQIAIAAGYFGVPVYVSGTPDKGLKTRGDISLEMRDGSFTLEAMGVKTAADGVKGYYPAFDITPPELITGIVTDAGIFAPNELDKYISAGLCGEFSEV